MMYLAAVFVVSLALSLMFYFSGRIFESKVLIRLAKISLIGAIPGFLVLISPFMILAAPFIVVVYGVYFLVKRLQMMKQA
jgi:hypothetical protein